jgi:hypothetical protein
MANQILLRSSVTILLVQIISIIYYGTPVLFSVLALLAAVTSILNHGFTSYIFKTLDRIYIPIYIVYNIVIMYLEMQDVWLLYTTYAITFSGIAAVIYAISVGNVIWHLFSHFILIIVHLIMCSNFKWPSLKTKDFKAL